MKYKAINSDLFIYNRSLLAKKLKENSIAIFNSNDIMPTNSDGTMPFKQNSDLFWLTGVDQEESLSGDSFDLTNNNMVIRVRTNKRKTVILLTTFSVLKIIIYL